MLFIYLEKLGNTNLNKKLSIVQSNMLQIVFQAKSTSVLGKVKSNFLYFHNISPYGVHRLSHMGT